MLVAKAVPRCFILQLSYRPSPGAVGCQFTASIALGPVKTGRSVLSPNLPSLSRRVASSPGRFETGAEYLGTVSPDTAHISHSFV